MAQLVARLVRNEKVRGSNPLSSTEVSRAAGTTSVTDVLDHAPTAYVLLC